jgi:hypothetical protein
MADRWSSWQAEQAGTNRAPSAGAALALFAAVALVLLTLLAAPWATTDSGQRLDPPACVELARLERHGVSSGPSWRRVEQLCQEATTGGR